MVLGYGSKVRIRRVIWYEIHFPRDNFTQLILACVSGPQLHPYFASLVPIVNDFARNLSPDTAPVLLSRPYIIPSTRYDEGRHPSVLAYHLSTLIPRPSSSSGTVATLAASVETIRGRSREESNAASSFSNTVKPSDARGGNFMGVKMDMRKWAWPDYLTFGRGSSIKPSVEKVLLPIEKETTNKEETPSSVEVEVDAEDLQDAITSDSMSLSSRTRRIPLQEEPNGSPLNGSAVIGEGAAGDDELSSPTRSTDVTSDRGEIPPSTPPLPEFSLTRLHLAPCDIPTATKRVSIHYFIVSVLKEPDASIPLIYTFQRNGYMLSLLHMQEQTDEGRASESTDLDYASENVTKLFDDIDAIINEVDMKGYEFIAVNSLPCFHLTDDLQRIRCEGSSIPRSILNQCWPVHSSQSRICLGLQSSIQCKSHP